MSRFVERDDILSWGRIPRGTHRVARPAFGDEALALIDEASKREKGALGVGARRSYGDSGLNIGGALIDMTGLDRLVSFDPQNGILCAEAGLTLGKALDFALPRGFFSPVSPGTQYVTLAGALANDVHGKNHHAAGTFGRWVREIELLRSDGARHILTPEDETGLFAATIGGLGLTGLITRVALQLQPVAGGWFDVETIPFGHVREFFTLARESEQNHDYTVAWVDVLAAGENLGRGIFTRANHALSSAPLPSKRASIRAPFDFPPLALNRVTISAFNALIYTRGRAKAGKARLPYAPFLYPLDSILEWNRMYGRRGFFQYQSVVPPEGAEEATEAMLEEISRAKDGSFLVVLKTFGDISSPGLLSFPMKGTTLALDFANRGEDTLRLMGRLDSIVAEAGGRLYPAKDGRMPADIFRSGYPALERFAAYRDSAFSSTFWNRMVSA